MSKTTILLNDLPFGLVKGEIIFNLHVPGASFSTELRKFAEMRMEVPETRDCFSLSLNKEGKDEQRYTLNYAAVASSSEARKWQYKIIYLRINSFFRLGEKEVRYCRERKMRIIFSQYEDQIQSMILIKAKIIG